MKISYVFRVLDFTHSFIFPVKQETTLYCRYKELYYTRYKVLYLVK